MCAKTKNLIKSKDEYNLEGLDPTKLQNLSKDSAAIFENKRKKSLKLGIKQFEQRVKMKKGLGRNTKIFLKS